MPPRPISPPIMPAHIPFDLKEAVQWVTWQWEWRKGKWTKPPLTAIGEPASVTDARTWASFGRAVAGYQMLKLDGIGRVLTVNDGYVGVDLDHCIEQDVIAPWAGDIVRQLDSYTEITPSGHGLRVWLRGTLPPGGRKNGNVEMYDAGRYLTCTGARLPDLPETIEERPAEILALHHQVFGEKNHRKPRISANGQPSGFSELDDAALLERARNAKNGSKFTALWDGDWSGYPSQSEADLALAGHLAFWTGRDPARMDALFRQSGLYRVKWDEKHYANGETHGQHTIALAISTGTEVYTLRASTRSEPEPDEPRRRQDGPEDDHQAGRPGGGDHPDLPGDGDAGLPGRDKVPRALDAAVALRTRRLSEVMAKPIDWVWRTRYARGFLTGLFGDGGTCKSTFDLTVMARLTTGRPMPFETVTRPPGTCVILSLEDDAETTIKPRFVAAGGDPERLVLVESVYNPCTGKRVRQVELERDLELLRAKLIEVQAVHFTISPVSAYLGSTRNSWKDSDVRAIIDPLHEMAARLHISGTLIAHPNKNTQQRAAYRMSGSQAFRNACRIVLVIGLDPEDATHERLVIVGEKRNIAEIAPPLAFHKVVQTYPIDGAEIEAVSLDFDLDQDLDRLQYTADYVLAAPPDTEEQAEIEVAKDFLAQTLGTAGERVLSEQVTTKARGLGISKRTLERARRALKVRAGKRPDGWALWISPKDHPVNQARRRG